MDITKSYHPNAIVLASAKIEISKTAVSITDDDYSLEELEDLGLARAVNITPAATNIEVQADNGSVPLKGQVGKKATVTFNLLERYLPLLAKIFPGVTLKVIPGTQSDNTDVYAAHTLTAGKLYIFKQFNGDGSAPASVVLTQDGTPLTEGADYSVGEHAGAYYFSLLPSGTFDSTEDLTVAYTVTPAASYQMGQGSSGVSPQIAMRLTNKRKTDDGRTISRIWDFPYGFYNGTDTIALKSKNDADNVLEVPMSFEFSPHPDMLENPDLEGWSLMREHEEI